MKRFFTLSFLFFSFCLCGQNLIPDPSAENFVECPTSFGNIETWLPNWQSFRGSPDYFNNCMDGLGSQNPLGFQEPRTGEGYLGIVTFSRNLSNAREYVGVELLEPMIIGQEYFLTFYVSRAHKSNTFNLATNNIGALFMTESNLNPQEQGPVPNFSSFNEVNLVEDTVNWVEMSYQFVADEAYQFVAFGNFYDDSLTDTLRIGGEPSGEVTGYYYLDDFCLTTSPDGCDFTNATEFVEKTEVLVYPVPCQDHLVVEQTTPIEQVEIYSTQGELLISHNGDTRNKTRLNIELPSGIYILVIYSDEQKQVKRFVVSN